MKVYGRARCAVAAFVVFVAISAVNGLRSGFYGVPPNATWYHDTPQDVRDTRHGGH